MEPPKRFRTAFAGAVVSVVSLAAVTAIGPAALGQYGPKPTTKPEYRGPILEDRKSEVRFDVKWTNGVPQRAIFEVRNVNLNCSDGTHRRTHFTAHDFHFQHDRLRIFHGRYKEYPAAAEASGYGGSYRVRGKLLKGGKAKGSLQTTTRVPPEEGPSCNTGGRLQWTAKKVR